MRQPTNRLLMLLLVALMLLSACKPKVPSQYIQPSDMEDLLYDYYVSQGLSADVNPAEGGEYARQYNINLVLKKYEVTQADFDSSLVYYYNHIEELYKIYENVQKRLSEEAVDLGAPSSEVMRYTTQSLTGDTAEVWQGPRHLVVLPQPPYNICQFTQKADTSYHQGDSYLMTCNSTFLAQSGSRNATLVLSVRYDNDSIITQNMTIAPSGSTTLRIPVCNLKAKEFKGYVYMARRQGQDNMNDMCLLFLNDIQFVRFHHKTTANTEPPVTLGDSIKSDTTRTDSVKRHVHRLGERPVPVKQEDTKPIIKPITK